MELIVESTNNQIIKIMEKNFEENQMNKGDFFSRHSIKPEGEDVESSDFEGISEKGVELAKERAQEIVDSLEELEDGSIMYIGGISELARTKSTAMVYGKEMQRLVAEREQEDVLYLSSEELEEIEGFNNKVSFLAEQINNNPDKKIIIYAPLFLNEFSMKKRWTDGDGNFTEYVNELLKRNGFNEEEAMKDWFDNKGQINGLEGPVPEDVAKEHLQGLERLREFASKYIADRSLSVGVVGHSINLDALAVYLVNNGEISKEAFEEMQGKLIGETKTIRITEKEGKQILKYGDIDIPI